MVVVIGVVEPPVVVVVVVVVVPPSVPVVTVVGATAGAIVTIAMSRPTPCVALCGETRFVRKSASWTIDRI